MDNVTLTSVFGFSLPNKLNNNSWIQDGAEKDIITDYMMAYIYTISLHIIWAAIALIGITTNVLNIIIFYRQGFQESINISLFSLAIADLFSLITLLGSSICFSPLLIYIKATITAKQIHHFYFAWSHVIFTRISALITVFISFERCLCISFPLRIKKMLSPLKVKIINGVIYAIPLGTLIPNLFADLPMWKFVPHLNRSQFRFWRSSGVGDDIKIFSHAIQIFYTIFTFSAVIICTYILVLKLRQRGKWLQSTATGDNATKSMARDQQVVKTVTYVALIFIVCYTPSFCFFVLLLHDTRYFLGGDFENSFLFFLSITFSFEGINSFANIFVYYKTNSKYRRYFKMLCCKITTNENVSENVTGITNAL